MRSIFPEATADEMNFVLFSTSGVHGTYATIEEVERASSLPYSIDRPRHITFLVVRPRVVALQYGNCAPETPEDFAFLKKLRETSWAACAKIGRDCAKGLH